VEKHEQTLTKIRFALGDKDNPTEWVVTGSLARVNVSNPKPNSTGIYRARFVSERRLKQWARTGIIAEEPRTEHARLNIQTVEPISFQTSLPLLGSPFAPHI